MAKFESGQRVVLVHTGVFAQVVRMEDHGIVIVKLEEDWSEIPVFVENIQDHGEWMASSTTFTTSDDYVPYVSEPVKDEELLFVLVPINVSAQGVAAKYELLLVNATAYDLYAEMTVLFNNEAEFTISERVKAFSPLKVDEFTPLEFGDRPSVQYSFQRILTTGVEAFKKGSLKLKDKTLMKAKVMIPLLDFPAIALSVWKKNGDKQPDTTGSLKDYTKKNVRIRPRKKVAPKPASGLFDPLRKAHFPTEIDLHIEKLAKNHKSLSNAQIVQIQMKAMQNYVDEAYQLGVDSVFLIHGVGKGYLRNAIHKRLNNNPHILTVKNEYHPKYGYGATEVIFL